MKPSDQLPHETRQKLGRLESLTEQCWSLQKWGFKRSARFGGMPYDTAYPSEDFHKIKYPVIIYDSEWCRIKITLDKERTHDDVHVFYGRSHAPDNEWLLTWRGEACYCWHNTSAMLLALDFLDGTSAREAYQRHLQPIDFILNYLRSEYAKSIGGYEKRSLKFHAAIWEQYGLRLIQLLDLRHADLWEQYIIFLREYYRLDEEESRIVSQQRGIAWSPSFDPPLYQRC
jgi:hypothetical protein